MTLRSENAVNDPGTQLAYVATGTHGLSIVDTSQFDNPIVLSALDLPGNSIDVAVDDAFAVAALASQGGGFHLVDVLDPMSPEILATVESPASVIEASGGITYVGSGSNLTMYDLFTGTLLGNTRSSARIQDVSVLGTRIFALTSDGIEILQRGGLETTRLGGISVGGSTAPLEIGRKLFVADDLAYVGSFEGFQVVDASDPTQPNIIGRSDETQAAVHDLVGNGSGLILPVTSFSGTSTLALSIYDGSDATDVTRFSSLRLTLPAMHGHSPSGAASRSLPILRRVVPS